MISIHREKAYEKEIDFRPISEDLADRSIVLPLYEGMSEDQIDYVKDSLKLIIEKK